MGWARRPKSWDGMRRSINCEGTFFYRVVILVEFQSDVLSSIKCCINHSKICYKNFNYEVIDIS